MSFISKKKNTNNNKPRSRHNAVGIGRAATAAACAAVIAALAVAHRGKDSFPFAPTTLAAADAAELGEAAVTVSIQPRGGGVVNNNNNSTATNGNESDADGVLLGALNASDVANATDDDDEGNLTVIGKPQHTKTRHYSWWVVGGNLTGTKIPERMKRQFMSKFVADFVERRIQWIVDEAERRRKAKAKQWNEENGGDYQNNHTDDNTSNAGNESSYSSNESGLAAVADAAAADNANVTTNHHNDDIAVKNVPAARRGFGRRDVLAVAEGASNNNASAADSNSSHAGDDNTTNSTDVEEGNATTTALPLPGEVQQTLRGQAIAAGERLIQQIESGERIPTRSQLLWFYTNLRNSHGAGKKAAGILYGGAATSFELEGLEEAIVSAANARNLTVSWNGKSIVSSYSAAIANLDEETIISALSGGGGGDDNNNNTDSNGSGGGISDDVLDRVAAAISGAAAKNSNSVVGDDDPLLASMVLRVGHSSSAPSVTQIQHIRAVVLTNCVAFILAIAFVVIR